MAGCGGELGSACARACTHVPRCEGGEALAQVAQRSCGCPLPGRVQGQAGWSSEQPGLVEGVPAHGRGLEPGDL